MPLEIKAIDHVQITVPPELEAACLEFYGSVLGLERIAKPEPLAARGGAWYRLGGIEIHVSLEPGADGSSSKRHVCFLVADLNSAREALAAAGRPIEPDSSEPNGLRRFFSRDPAGNKLEFGTREHS